MRASVCSAGADDLTNTVDEMKVAMRQIAGAFSQLEKSRLVRKLREARERKRAETGKCEGRKSYAEVRPEVVALAKELRSGGMSLRKISAERVIGLAAASLRCQRSARYARVRAAGPES